MKNFDQVCDPGKSATDSFLFSDSAGIYSLSQPLLLILPVKKKRLIESLGTTKKKQDEEYIFAARSKDIRQGYPRWMVFLSVIRPESLA